MKKLVVALALTGAWAVQAEPMTYGTVDVLEYRNGRIGGARDEATVVFPNADLSEWTPKFSWFRSTTDPVIYGADGPAFACNVKAGNDGTSDGVYADFQRWYGNIQVYSTRVFFFQDGMDIKAYVTHARYSQPNYFLMGEDLVAMYADPARKYKVGSQTVARFSSTNRGYGIDHILMERKTFSVCRPTSYADVSLDVWVKGDADLRLDDDAAFAAQFPDAVNPAAFNVDGRLTVDGVSGTFAGNISGRGMVEFRTQRSGTTEYYEDYVQEEGTIIAPHGNLATLTSITCELKGSNAPNGQGGVKGVRFSGDGRIERWAMQVIRASGDNRFLVHVPLELKQVGAGIQARITGRPRYMYVTNTNFEVEFGMDMEDPRYTSALGLSTVGISYNGNTGGYGMHKIYTTCTGACDGVSITAENLMKTGGVFCVGAAAGSRMVASLTARTNVCQYGLIRIKSGGELSLDYQGNPNGAGFGLDRSRICVETNGVLNVPIAPGKTYAFYQLGHDQTVEIRGGSLILGEGMSPYASGRDVSCYCNLISFIGGGTLTCPTWVRVGNRSSSTCTAAVWRVIGKGVATCNCGIDLITYAKDDKFADLPTQALLLSVEDTSGDAAPDLVINGRVNHYNDVQGLALDPAKYDSDARNMCIVKDYDGTVRFNGVYRPYRPTRIVNGTLMLGVSGSTTAEQAFELGGGALAVAESTTNTVGAITVVKSGKVVLGDRASLSVADCSSASWASGAMVEIVGDLKTSELRFGDSASALTAAQVRALRCDGKRVALADDGRVYTDLGVVIIFR